MIRSYLATLALRYLTPKPQPIKLKPRPDLRDRRFAKWDMDRRIFTRKPTLADTLRPDPNIRRRIFERRDAAGVQRYLKANEGLL
jgi:hypothetical protein